LAPSPGKIDKGPALKRNPEAGFTFMEVMVALAIVASLMVTLVYTTNYNLDVAGRHEALTVATMLARDKMTAVRRDPRDELREKKGKFPEPFEDFTFEVEVKDRSMPVFGFPVNVTEIDITVTGRGETVYLRKILQQGKVSS